MIGEKIVIRNNTDKVLIFNYTELYDNEQHLQVTLLPGQTKTFYSVTNSFSYNPVESPITVVSRETFSTVVTTTTTIPVCTTYTVSDIPYTSYTITSGTSVVLADDTISAPINIGFTFPFFENSYTQAYIGSNGWVGFSSGQSTSGIATIIPTPPGTGGNPKNCIMGPWMDFNPSTPGGPYIQYETQGSAPNRRFVVQFTNLPHFVGNFCPSGTSTFQIVIFETTGIIENHILNKSTCITWNGGRATQGVYNRLGTAAVVVPGRNATRWVVTNDGKRYDPCFITTTTTTTIAPTTTTTTTIAPTPTPSVTVTPTITITPTSSPTTTTTISPTSTPSVTVTPTTTTTTTTIPVNPASFISVWSASTGTTSISLPYVPTGTYSGTIDWGDGSVSANTYANRNHTYPSGGTYTVTITGDIVGWNFQTSATGSRNKILEITQWGTLRGLNNSNSGMFYSCSRLSATNVLDVIDLSGITATTNMFFECISINKVNNISSWNTSSVVDMSYMFNRSGINENINSWDVSNVTNMSYMFEYANFMNTEPLSGWNTSNVTNMQGMFQNNVLFNSYIGNWDTSNVQDMSFMFLEAQNFNQDISGWNTSGVTNMDFMFDNALDFNQDLSSWCVLQIPTKPFGFDGGTISWTGGTSTRPQWGVICV